MLLKELTAEELLENACVRIGQAKDKAGRLAGGSPTGVAKDIGPFLADAFEAVVLGQQAIITKMQELAEVMVSIQGATVDVRALSAEDIERMTNSGQLSATIPPMGNSGGDDAIGP